jgi:membrane-bound inhibitor of C-type lysozyme
MKTSPLLQQTFAKLLITLCASGLSVSGFAADTTTSPSPAKKQVKAKPTKIAKANSKNAEIDTTEPEPNIEQSADTEYKCELGNSLVMYTHPEDSQSLAMRWRNRLYKLTRVETSTGAHRFENQKIGLVWINIPSKGMLLDSRRGHQLANECKSTKVASLSTSDTQVK